MEQHEEAIALATSIFVAGFFLGVGTGILLAPHATGQGGPRLKRITTDLLGDATRAIQGATEPTAG